MEEEGERFGVGSGYEQEGEVDIMLQILRWERDRLGRSLGKE